MIRNSFFCSREVANRRGVMENMKIFRRHSLQEPNAGYFASDKRRSSYVSDVSSRGGEEDGMVASNGRHVDVSQLTDLECNKVIDVISKDILLRKSEKERIAYVNKKFEDFRRTLTIANTTRKKRLPFDDYCLICGKHLFTFICLLNLGEECISCEHQCCSTCRKGFVLEGDDWTDPCYICTLCLEKRDCKRKSFEWFHEIVEKRFKRFGSAKILRAIYKQRSAIEPRVITLLAHCRELQPTRRMSITSLQKKFSVNYSKDDDKVTYSSSYSDIDKGRRKKFNSESEVFEQSKENIRPRSFSDLPNRKTADPEDGRVIQLTSVLDRDDSEKDTVIQKMSPSSTTNKPNFKKQTSHKQPESLQFVIAENKEEEELAIMGNKHFSKVDYLGLVSITLTICFIVALFTCIGFMFDVSDSSEPEDEEVE